jgi:hypothetical protein
MSQRYDIGDRVRLTGTFHDEAYALANPSVVTLTVRKPDGTLLTPTPTNPSTGVFTALVDLDTSGRWTFRYAGTGTLVTAGEDGFSVRVSMVL